MKERLTIRKRGHITLPKSILKRYGLAEGDSLEVSVDEQTGEMKVVPMVQIPADQRWFWTKEWQAGEQEAEADMKANRLGRPISNQDDLDKYFADLDEQ
jgi:AbrB family looped-hinge helix DNA binding protein